MIKEYFCEYGCYTNMEAIKAIVTYPDTWSKDKIESEFCDELYEKAREISENMHGMHGFGTTEEEFKEENEWDENLYYEIVREEIGEAAEYWFTPWDEKYASDCTYGTDSEPSIEEFNYV